MLPGLDPAPVAQSPNADPSGDGHDRGGSVGSRLDALLALPADLEGLRRGLVWVAGELQACERGLRQVGDEVMAIGSRVGAVEGREGGHERVLAGLEKVERELTWVSGEVQARAQSLDRVAGELARSGVEISELRGTVQAQVASMRDQLGDLNVAVEELAGQVSALRVDPEGGTPLSREAVTVVERAVSALRSGVTADLAWLTRVQAATAVAVAVELDVLRDRLGPLEALPLQLSEVREQVAAAREAESLAEQQLEVVGTRLDEMQAELSRFAADVASAGEMSLAAVDARTGPLEDGLANLRSSLELLADEMAVAGRLAPEAAEAHLAPLQERLSAMEEALAQVREEASAAAEISAANLETRSTVFEARLSELHDGLDRIGTVLESASEGRTEELARIHRELDRLVDSQMAGGQEAAHLALRVDPLEGSVEELRHEVGALREELAEARNLLVQALADRFDSVDMRVRGVESIPEELVVLHSSIEQLSTDLVATQQAALAATTEQIATMARLRELDAMPAEVSALRQAVESVGENGRALLDEALAGVERETAPLEAAIDELREVVARIESEVVAFPQAAASTAADQEARLETYAGRLAALEGLAPELERLAAEVEQVGAGVVDAKGELAARVDALSGRVVGLEEMPTELEGVYREVERLTELTLARHAELAEVAGPTGVLGTRIDGLRDQVEALSAGFARDLASSAADQQAGVEALAQRVQALEAVAPELERLAADVEQAGQGVVEVRSELSHRFDLLTDRLVSLEGLPTELEGVYREVERVSELTLARHVELAETVGPSSPFGSRVEGLRGELESLSARLEGELERLTEGLESSRSDTIEALAALEARVSPLAETVVLLRSELDGVGDRAMGAERIGEALAARWEEADARAGQHRHELQARLDELEAVPSEVGAVAHDVEQLRTELSSLARDRDRHLAGLAERLEALEALLATVGRMSDELEQLGRTGSDGQAALAERLEALEALVPTVGRMSDELVQLAQATSGSEASLAGLGERLDRVSEEMVAADRAVLAGAGQQIDAVGRQVEAIGQRVSALEPVAEAVTRVEGELARVALQVEEAVETSRRELADMVTPLRSVVGGLEAEIDRLSAAVATSDETAEAGAVSLEALGDRLRRLEEIPSALVDLREELDRLAGDLANLPSPTPPPDTRGQIGALGARVESLEGLRTDVEGLYAALYQVAETVTSLRRDSAVP